MTGSATPDDYGIVITSAPGHASPETALAIAQLREELARTNDLFRRRLFDDRDKRALYDELYRQLEISRAGTTREAIAPVARRVLLAADRLSRHANGDEFLLSIQAELLEVFEQYGLRRVPSSGLFDPSQHESLGVVPGPVPGDVASEVRSGYWLGDVLLRPAQVMVTAQAVSESDVDEV